LLPQSFLKKYQAQIFFLLLFLQVIGRLDMVHIQLLKMFFLLFLLRTSRLSKCSSSILA